jgi:hypothetical protein
LATDDRRNRDLARHLPQEFIFTGFTDLCLLGVIHEIVEGRFRIPGHQWGDRLKLGSRDLQWMI